MKYLALTSVAVTLAAAIIGCKAVSHNKVTAFQPDSFRCLDSDNPSDNSADYALRGSNQTTDGYDQPQKEATGLKYVGNGFYNFFSRPFKKKPDDHCTRNWLGFKVSDIVDGVPAPKERMQQIRQLGEAANEVDAQRSEKYIAALTSIIKSDPDSNCRAAAVESVGKYKSESAAYALNLALTDKVRFVRIAACHAWKTNPNPKMGADALNRLLLSENDKDVSLAAVQALQFCGDSSSNEALNRMLETADPALQIAAMNSLGSIHHSACRDINQWRQFCKGEIQSPGEPQKKESVVETLQFWK